MFNTIALCLGWVHESIGYRVRLVPDDESTDDDSLLDFSSDCDSNFDGRRRKHLEMERTLVQQCYNYVVGLSTVITFLLLFK